MLDLNYNCDIKIIQNVTMLFFLILILVRYEVDCDSNYYVIQMPDDDPPNNRIPMNNPPMHVYWNVPTMQCTSKKVLFENLYQKYGIIQNQGDSFRGEKISILYDPGLFPAIFKNETSGKFKFRNGGVPQEGDLEKHIESFRNILNQSIPDEKFDGLAIIDFESWRPVYRQNFGVLTPYKDVSYEIERNNHWWWPSSMVTAEAKRRFEEAARVFMGQTLKVAKEMRPLAKWGYYAYPYCFNTKTEECADKVTAENDYLSWFWPENTALYPSVYSPKDLTSYQLSQLVKGRVKETERVRNAHGRMAAPIYPYYWFKYRDGGFMKEEDVHTVFQTFDNSEAAGFIIWGSSNDVNTLDKCVKLLNYVENVLGPTVAKYTKKQRIIHDLEAHNESAHRNTSIVENNEHNVDVSHKNTTAVEDNYGNKDVTNHNQTINDVNNRNETIKDVFISNKTIDKNETLIELIEENNPNVEIDFNNYDELNENYEEQKEINHTEEYDKVFDEILPDEPLNLSVLEKNTTTGQSLTTVTEKESYAVTKSRWSLYSEEDSIIIDKIINTISLTTTETPIEVTSTDSKLFEAEISTLDPEFIRDTPENYKHDIEKYVKEESLNELHNISSLEKDKPMLENNSKNNTLIELLLDTILQYRSYPDEVIVENKITTKQPSETHLNDGFINETMSVVTQNISKIFGNDDQDTKLMTRGFLSSFVTPVMSNIKEMLGMDNSNGTNDNGDNSNGANSNGADGNDNSQTTISIENANDFNDEVMFDNYLEANIMTTTDNYLDINITLLTDKNQTKDVITIESTTDPFTESNNDNTTIKEYLERINVTLKLEDVTKDESLERMNNTSKLEDVTKDESLGRMNVTSKLEDVTKDESTNEEPKMHHTKNRKKGKARCHHHTSEEQNTSRTIDSTASTSIKPDKNTTSTSIKLNKNKIIEVNFITKNKKKGSPTNHQHQHSHDIPVSEELMSSDFVTDKVPKSSSSPSSRHSTHYLCFIFYFYSVSKCLL